MKGKQHNDRVLAILLALSLSVSLLAGCQISSEESVDTTEPKQEDSQNMSAEGNSTKDKVQIESANEKYPYANDRAVYVPTDTGVEQWSLSGEQGNTYALSESFMQEDLLWVDNDEIIWKDDTEMYSAPIQQTDDGEVILEHERKVLFSGEEVMELRGSDWRNMEPGNVYVNDKYILVWGNPYYLYDRESGELRSLSGKGLNGSWNAKSIVSRVCGDYMIGHRAAATEQAGQRSYGFGAFDFIEDEWHPIDGRCFNTAAYVADSENKKVYYQIADNQSTWVYDNKTGEKQEFISENEWKACYEENGLVWEDAYYNDSMFVVGERCYFIKNEESPLVFSWSLSESGVRYEAEVTNVVRDYVQAYGSKSTSYWLQLAIVGKQLLLRWEDEEGGICAVCVDLDSAKSKVLQSYSEPEMVYFAVIGLWDSEEKDFILPQIQETEKTTTEAVALKEEEQLQLIWEKRKIWLNRNYMPYFTVTDLDHNGRLEIIVSTDKQGSGRFTSSVVYQVSADGKNLRQCTTSWFSSESIHTLDDDIVYGMKTVYFDKKTNTWYYRTNDFVSGGMGIGTNSFENSLVLKNGTFWTDTFAGYESLWSKKKEKLVYTYYSYVGGKEREISRDEYSSDQLEKTYFAGLEKRNTHIKWMVIPKKKKRTKKVMLEKMRKSYQSFAG